VFYPQSDVGCQLPPMHCFTSRLIWVRKKDRHVSIRFISRASRAHLLKVNNQAIPDSTRLSRNCPLFSRLNSRLLFIQNIETSLPYAAAALPDNYSGWVNPGAEIGLRAGMYIRAVKFTVRQTGNVILARIKEPSRRRHPMIIFVLAALV